MNVIILAAVISILGMFLIFASAGKTPEASELEGYPLVDRPQVYVYDNDNWEDYNAIIKRVDVTKFHTGDFPEGTPIGVFEDGKYLGEFLSDGEGGYKRDDLND